MTFRRSFFILLPGVAALIILGQLIAEPVCTAAEVSTQKETYLAELSRLASKQQLDSDHYWHILLHYRPGWFSGVKSEIDSKDFYFAKDGRTNPRSELLATLAAFFEPGPAAPPKEGDPQHAQCRFIDRYQWLKKRLQFNPVRLPEQPCPDYAAWSTALDPESATMVFSSFYMNNPSSAFGHTLLRLNHRKRSKDSTLLDYGINYAANPNSNNPFVYAFLGLTGGYPGYFSNIPYYVKVQEYNDFESRDLWEYDLNLTPEELQKLIWHLWTVGHITTPYYFLDRNCSYMVLTLLDAARPQLRISNEFAGRAFVIPTDTIRSISARSGLVKDIHVRPSLATRIQKQRELLTREQDHLFLAMIRDKGAEAQNANIERIQRLATAEASRVIDLTLDYLRFRKAAAKNELEPEDARLQGKLLLIRSELPERAVDVRMEQDEFDRKRPDVGHPIPRVGLGGGYSNPGNGFAEMSWRPAFRDLNSSSFGYPKYSEIEVLTGNIRYYPSPSRFAIERLDFANIRSVTPMDRLFRKFAWSMRLGVDPVTDFECDRCLEAKGNIGGGAAFELPSSLLYLLVKTELGASGAFKPHYRLGPVATVGWLFRPNDRFGVELNGSYQHPVLGFTSGFFQGHAEASIETSARTDLRVGGDFAAARQQGKLVLNAYY